ncbi:MAG: DUF3053 family protein [Rickettsiaceae bacterium]|nr:DUF3053 family protein [Rickettsiaceae bacterium]
MSLFGKLVFFFLFPFLFAVLAWYISWKRKAAASWAFNIILTLIVLGQIGQIGRIGQYGALNQRLHEAELGMYNNINNPEKFDEAYNELIDVTYTALEKVCGKNTGLQKHKSCKIIYEFVDETKLSTEKWNKAVDTMDSLPSFLLLDNDAEFNHYKDTFRNYIKSADVYQEKYNKLLQNALKQLNNLDRNSVITQVFIKEFKEEIIKSQPKVNKLMQKHKERGSMLLQLVDFLQENRDKWSFENDELAMENDVMINKYSELLETATKIEDELESLAKELLKVDVDD